MTVGTQAKEHSGNALLFSNTSTLDNEVTIETSDISQFDTFMVHSSAGAVDVFGSLDGSTYVAAPLSLQDMGATTTDPVVVTAAGRVYGFRGKFRKLRVLQNGDPDVTAQLLCGNI
jgi:hypothetical protein